MADLKRDEDDPELEQLALTALIVKHHTDRAVEAIAGGNKAKALAEFATANIRLQEVVKDHHDQ